MLLDFLKLEFENPDPNIIFINGTKSNTDLVKHVKFKLGDEISFSYKGIRHDFVATHNWNNRTYFVSRLPLEQSNHSDLYNVLSEIREYFPAKLIEVMAKTKNRSNAETYEHEDLFVPCLANYGASTYGRVADGGDDSRYTLFRESDNLQKGEQWWLDDFMKSNTGVLVSLYGMAAYAGKGVVGGVVVAFAIDFEPMRAWKEEKVNDY